MGTESSSLSHSDLNNLQTQRQLLAPSIMDNDPGLPPGAVPPEKEYSAEKLAQIHAAMMEELGLSRLDTLHLADKGPPVEVLRSLQKPRKIANTAVAAWHSKTYPAVNGGI